MGGTSALHEQKHINDTVIVVHMRRLSSKHRYQRKTISSSKTMWLVPIVIYYDLESIIKPVAGCQIAKQSTRIAEIHQPSFCFLGIEYGKSHVHATKGIEKLVKIC